MNDSGEPGRGRQVRDGLLIDPQDGYEFMKAHRGEFAIVAMCRALGLSASGYYDWLKRAAREGSPRDDDVPGPDPGASPQRRWEVGTGTRNHAPG
ncbi:MAG: hypothetical protein OXU69_13355 [Gemmatimonadota bacterium]|nr:hypothetical protein [Gemmatimonadota bacterium]MDE2985687.1 hypothetical protein [Gemmatimonadota bacterium]